MATAHRKIELQSPDDLTYLLTNLQSRATALLAQNFPPHDALHAAVSSALQSYISTLYALARPNLAINGVDVHDAWALDSYEPFDAKLAERVMAAAAEVEAETLRVAQMRREVAACAAGRVGGALVAGVRALEIGEGVVEGGEEVVGGLERQAEVEGTWEEAVGVLKGVKVDLPATAAKLERAKAAVEYVESR
ncbi:MAG: hypothetical protein M1829_006705 [Trizodia sp. TS-e1964]|nr:MAG: hypothetical protein M1829_006705 [Trizodia sp. TS-e1964]